MRINTRTDSLELTKPERKTLRDSLSLLRKIAKHADGPAEESASVAAEELEKTLASLEQPEAVVG